MRAADSTLRDGRKAALRNPSRATAQAPRPVMSRVSRARSQPASHEQRADEQRRARAEERAGLRGRHREAETEQRRSPATAKTTANQPVAARRAGCRPIRDTSIDCAVNNARGESRATARSETSTHTAAATHAANRPDHQREPAATCSSSSRRPDRADPPRAEAVHDERAVQDRAGDRRCAPPATARTRPRRAAAAGRLDIEKPDGAQDADLAQPLLDAQPEEEHGEHQRRDHQEEAEVGEVLAEVGRALRRLERGRRARDRAPRPWHSATAWCASSRAAGVRPRAAVRIGSRVGEREGSDANRRQRAVPRSPQIAAALVGDERLRRRAVVVPVAFVPRPHAREVDRKRRIPVGQAVRARDARDSRAQVVGRRPGRRSATTAGERERRACA